MVEKPMMRGEVTSISILLREKVSSEGTFITTVQMHLKNLVNTQQVAGEDRTVSIGLLGPNKQKGTIQSFTTLVLLLDWLKVPVDVRCEVYTGTGNQLARAVEQLCQMQRIQYRG